MSEVHSELQCQAQFLGYDFDTRVGRLVLAEGECVDMTGCVSIFERIDPNVRQIQTVAGEELDTVYTRTTAGWLAA